MPNLQQWIVLLPLEVHARSRMCWSPLESFYKDFDPLPHVVQQASLVVVKGRARVTWPQCQLRCILTCGQAMENTSRQVTKAGWQAAGRTVGGGLPTCGGGEGRVVEEKDKGQTTNRQHREGQKPDARLELGEREWHDWWLGLGRGYELDSKGDYWVRSKDVLPKLLAHNCGCGPLALQPNQGI